MLPMPERSKLTDQDYRRLRDFRAGLRRFLRWSEERAAGAGLTPAQHQLLLSIRASEDPWGPTIRSLSEQLLLKHHSAVELIDRAEQAGLVRRVSDPDDHRVVRLELTADGGRRLARLSSLHLQELARLAPRLGRLWSGL